MSDAGLDFKVFTLTRPCYRCGYLMSHTLPPALHRLLPFWVDNEGTAHYRGKLRTAKHTRMDRT